MNTQQLLDYIDRQWEENIIDSLSDYIKIPNKSPHFDANWQSNGYMEEAIAHLTKWCQSHAPKNMALEIIRLEGRTPLLFIDIPGEDDETVLLYGHLDKQPEMEGWKEGYSPWQPVLEDGKLYGRGSADDGYAIYAALTAICALQKQDLPHARCVIIIEACEESGSYDLPYYIEVIKDRIGHPSLVVCLDSGAGNYSQLWVTTSLRGNVGGELSVELLTEGVHSGNASGIVPDSFRVARHLLNRIENDATGEIKLSALHCEIPPDRTNEAADCAVVLGEHVFDVFPFVRDVLPIQTNFQQLILNRTWRPALTVTGANGLPSIENAGNVLRPKTSLKLSMRLPPLVDVNKAADVMTEALTDNPPHQANVSFNANELAMGWNAPPMSRWLSKAVYDASLHFFQQPVVYMGEGGTIPFMSMLGKQFPKAQFMITGVLGPNSNAHGPNEFLHLDMVKKLTACVSYVLYRHVHSKTHDVQ